MNDLFFRFLRFSMNTSSLPEEDFQNINWQELFSFAEKQALIGVLFDGISRLPKSWAPPEAIFLHWLALYEQIRKRNGILNAEAVRICKMFLLKGWSGCILKGQGNALLYPDVYSRMPGDIDVWLCPLSAGKGKSGLKSWMSLSGRRELILKTVRHWTKDTQLCYHHIGFDSPKGIRIEAHFTPGVMNDFLYNCRLQKWFERNRTEQFSHLVDLPGGVGKIAVPTADFNSIYQLAHICHHFFNEGIGLRQLMDYYYVLLDGDLKLDKAEYAEQLRYLGLYHFAGAVMYVLKEVFGLPGSQMPIPEDRKRGRIVLNEILYGGNFGKFFTKYDHFTHRNKFRKYFLKTYRNLHFLPYFPAESLSEPLFRTWQFFWRQWKQRCQN